MAKLALFQHEPYCSRDCCAGITAALSASHEITLIGLRDLQLGSLAHYDLVIFPGGRGEASEFHTLFRHHADAVRAYVKQGGRYLGICMGAYWADSHYFNLLHEMRCAQYITRPDAEIRRSYPTLARILWKGQTQKMYFFDGCTFLGDAADTKVIATYANGDVMALIQNTVGVIGCHPESEAHWYYSKALKSAWHETRHHTLLLEFVNEMLCADAAQTLSTRQTRPADLNSIHDALQMIADLTQPFARGTHQKVNHIAHRALAQLERLEHERPHKKHHLDKQTDHG